MLDVSTRVAVPPVLSLASKQRQPAMLDILPTLAPSHLGRAHLSLSPMALAGMPPEVGERVLSPPRSVHTAPSCITACHRAGLTAQSAPATLTPGNRQDRR